jgi:hypothetical protein
VGWAPLSRTTAAISDPPVHSTSTARSATTSRKLQRLMIVKIARKASFSFGRRTG